MLLSSRAVCLDLSGIILGCMDLTDVKASFELQLDWSLELPTKPRLPTASITIHYETSMRNCLSTDICPLLSINSLQFEIVSNGTLDRY